MTGQAPLPIGTRVVHTNRFHGIIVDTKQVGHATTWGPTWEYLVQKDEPAWPGDPNQPTWWAANHTTTETS